LPEKCFKFNQIGNHGDSENNNNSSVEEDEEKDLMYFAVKEFGVKSAFFEDC
jgi:hypothetical protein